jgi:prevent-host-death family protein
MKVSEVMQFNVHQAKSQLSQLLFAVEKGEEVVIARNGVPIAQLVATKRLVVERNPDAGQSGPQTAELLESQRLVA